MRTRPEDCCLVSTALGGPPGHWHVINVVIEHLAVLESDPCDHRGPSPNLNSLQEGAGQGFGVSARDRQLPIRSVPSGPEIGDVLAVMTDIAAAMLVAIDVRCRQGGNFPIVPKPLGSCEGV